MNAQPIPQGSFWKRWVPLVGAGMLGVGSMVPQTVRLIRSTGRVSDSQLPLVVAASTLQSGLILGGLVAVGVALAPKIGLRSHLAARFAEGTPFWPAFRPELPLAVAGGVTSVALISAAEAAFRPFVGDAVEALNAAMPHNSLYVSLLGLLYGGITEELWLRWGIMTGLAWTGWRLAQLGAGRLRPTIMWTSNVLASLIFGALHLPFTATIVPLTPALVARALALNGIAGIIFGWLYWKRSLEAAMAAHATFHATLTVVTMSTGLGRRSRLLPGT